MDDMIISAQVLFGSETAIMVTTDDKYLVFKVKYCDGDRDAVQALIEKEFPDNAKDIMKTLLGLPAVFEQSNIDVSALASLLPGYHKMVKHPVEGYNCTIGAAIMSLNDSCKWSREQIADWIETLDQVPTFTERIEVVKKELPAPTVLATFKPIL